MQHWVCSKQLNHVVLLNWYWRELSLLPRLGGGSWPRLGGAGRCSLWCHCHRSPFAPFTSHNVIVCVITRLRLTTWLDNLTWPLESTWRSHSTCSLNVFTQRVHSTCSLNVFTQRVHSTCSLNVSTQRVHSTRERIYIMAPRKSAKLEEYDSWKSQSQTPASWQPTTAQVTRFLNNPLHKFLDPWTLSNSLYMRWVF